MQAGQFSGGVDILNCRLRFHSDAAKNRSGDRWHVEGVSPTSGALIRSVEALTVGDFAWVGGGFFGCGRGAVIAFGTHGGGGSSYTAPGITGVTHTAGARAGDGQIVIQRLV